MEEQLTEQEEEVLQLKRSIKPRKPNPKYVNAVLTKKLRICKSQRISKTTRHDYKINNT